MVNRSLISVVDDDVSLRESLPELLKELGFVVHTFSSGEEFLESASVLQTQCLILDIAMPGMSGPEVQRQLELRGQRIPIVFITGQGDTSVRPHLIEQGAVDCLFKPFTEEALIGAINAAFGVG